MTHLYLADRVNPDIDADEVESALSAVASAFGTGWLNAPGSHPVRELWKRRDFIATDELFWLGSALQQMNSIDKWWVRRHIRTMKRGGKNERIGSAFELLGAAALAASGQTVMVRPHCAPGYDLDVGLQSGTTFRISMKNFGRSDAQREFERSAKKLERLIRAHSAASATKWVGVSALCHRYPDADAWEALTRLISPKINRCSATNEPFEIIAAADGKSELVWSGRFHSPSTEGIPLSTNVPSFSLQVYGVRHQSEKRGFLRKVAQAAEDFERYAQRAGYGRTRVLFARIAEQASIEECTGWSEEFLSDETKHIDEIILYQPAIRYTEAETALVHYVSVAARTEVEKLSMGVPVGVISSGPVRHQRGVGDNGVPLDEVYWYERGEMYPLYTGVDEQGSVTLRSLAVGVSRHAAVRMPDGTEHLYTAAFPPSRELTLLD